MSSNTMKKIYCYSKNKHFIKIPGICRSQWHFLLLGNVSIKTPKEENKNQFSMDGDTNYFTKLKT